MEKFTADQAGYIEYLLIEDMATQYRLSKYADSTPDERRECAEKVELARSCLSTLNELREVL